MMWNVDTDAYREYQKDKKKKKEQYNDYVKQCIEKWGKPKSEITESSEVDDLPRIQTRLEELERENAHLKLNNKTLRRKLEYWKGQSKELAELRKIKYAISQDKNRTMIRALKRGIS